MQQKLKNYLKLGMLLFGISFIVVNCQKEDGLKPQPHTKKINTSTTKSVSAKGIPEVISFIQSKSNRNMEFVLNDNNSGLG